MQCLTPAPPSDPCLAITAPIASLLLQEQASQLQEALAASQEQVQQLEQQLAQARGEQAAAYTQLEAVQQEVEGQLAAMQQEAESVRAALQVCGLTLSSKAHRALFLCLFLGIICQHLWPTACASPADAG